MASARPAYDGTEPYFFVCYSHEDSATVLDEIAWLQDQGIRVWYDQRISTGVRWSDDLAQHILGAAGLLFFVSPRSAASENCLDEINFALDNDKPVIAVHLESTELPPGASLRLAHRQAIHRYELNEHDYQTRLSLALNATPPELKKGNTDSRSGRWMAPLAIVVLAIAAATTYFLWPSRSSDAPVESQIQHPLRNSIAVLPLENLSPDPNNAYFAAGMHEEILNQLAKIKELSVIARTSVQGYADGAKAIPQIGQELNVSTVMEGSVRYAGDRVRITAQLVDANSGLNLWSDAYDRDLGDIFEIQSDIARSVTGAMKVQFALAEQQSIAKQPTDNPNAYAHYIRAMALRRNLDSPNPVHQGLDQAIALDPNFAQAMAAKAWLYGFQTEAPFTGNDPTPDSQQNFVRLAQEYAERALEIDPDQAEAHLALSIVDQFYRRWDGRLSRAKTAYELNPNHYVIAFWYGRVLIREGRVDDGIKIIERAAELDPRNWSIHHFFGLELGWAQRWDRARQHLELVTAMAPDFPPAYELLALFGACYGDDELALNNARILEERGVTTPLLMNAYSRIGRTSDANRLLKAATTNGHTVQFSDADWVVVYLAVGQYDRALDHLESLVDKNFPFSWIYNMHDHPDHPLYEDLRRHARFADILSRIEDPL